MTSGNAEVPDVCLQMGRVEPQVVLDPRAEPTSGLSQLDVTVGWPRGPAYPACTGANPENCKYKFAVTTYFRPLPTAP